MELVQHEDVHSRQASVLTFKCSLSKDGQWIRSRSDCDPQMYSPRRGFIVNSTWITELHIRELKLSRDVVWTFYSWVYVTYLLRDLQYHPTSMGWGSRSLRWLIPFSWSLHRIGCPDIRTQICCGRARPHFSPRWMTLTCWLTNDCDLPAPTPTTYTKHTPRAVA